MCGLSWPLGVAGGVLVAGRAGGGRGRGVGGKVHSCQLWRVCGRVLSVEAFSAHGTRVMLGGDKDRRDTEEAEPELPRQRPAPTGPCTHLLQPRNDTVVVKEVIAGQLPDRLLHAVVLLADRTLQTSTCTNRKPHAVCGGSSRAGACRSWRCWCDGSSVNRLTHVPTCSSVMEMAGKLFILSLSAGGGPVFSNWFNNCT